MTTIPQRELRNNVSDVLRRAELGERFTITVTGRPVAELGPPARAVAAPTGEQLTQLLAATPVDGGWRDELTAMRNEDRAAARDERD